ncbi:MULTISPECIES: hypothetical protein [Ralstonia]|uniref:Uncharacterized protein n=1 Tax=Ralstonia flatus TaxID=3058601 RepID=A0AAD2BX29_9RALS|nr:MULTISPECIES: hypothetical protein [Ralstonia]MBN6211220.1 hypothetical protein [Ralstonia pickettii]PLT18965.1 hypothetical protein CXP34_02965 [Ralstonia mannitolilytica]CAJ0817068.1 hypothetical protein LMG19087_02972 [Ralstonia wenshanensis]CAJ0859835.1 hypothetical protein R77567_01401 [Ralstonia sp. LMG 32965]CAJ0867882.1 hypothetical protein R77564_01418 [Ralstonia sp. LMG 32965]
MELKDARDDAKKLLMTLIEQQPAMFGSANAPNGRAGETAAHFCSMFIETYAAYLVKTTE